MGGRRGRPAHPKPAIEFHLHLRLMPGEDDDLIGYLNGQPAGRRAAAIKIALRGGMALATTQPTDNFDDDFDAALDSLLF